MAAKVGASKNVRRSSRAPRKRKIEESSPSVAGSEPKQNCIEKKSQDGRNIDGYCWTCHKFGQDEKCFTCPRVYHSMCLKKASNVFSKEGVCPECLMNSIDGTKLSKTLTCIRLKELLLAATKQRKNGIPKKELGIHKIFFNWPVDLGRDELVRVIDFQILIDKINDIVPYTKTSEFFSDVKWIQHNCFILYGANSKVTDAAIKLVKAFKKDLLDLEACPECYFHMLCYNSADFFVRICDPPHDIIWAQVSGYPYWPAKCLKVVGGTAHVRFFGRHEMGDIPISQCYFISKEHPNQPQRSAPKTLKYNDAIDELMEYVKLYERTPGMGPFHYYEGKTAFKPENAVQKPSRDIPDKDIPVSKPSSSKPNISAIPLHIDMIAREEESAYGNESAEQSSCNSVPIISNPVAVTMTFSEEQSKSNNFDSSDSMSSTIDSSFDPVQPIDIQSCTATKVVDSTPVIAAADSILNVSSDDLSLGAEFSNSDPVSQPSVNEDTNESMNHLSKISQILLKSVCNINEQMMGNSSENMPLGFPCDNDRDLYTIFERISGSSRHCKGCNKATTSKKKAAKPNFPIDEEIILDSPDSSSRVPKSQIDNSLIMSYLSQGRLLDSLNKDFRALFFTLFINMWSLANSAPAAPEVLATIIMDLKKQHNMLFQLKKEIKELKNCDDNSQCVANKLQETITDLKTLLEAEKRKNEDMRVEFKDATNNAKLVVDSVKRSSDNFWSKKIKECSSIYNQKLAEKEHIISEFSEHLEALRADYNALEAQKVEIENMYDKALNEVAKFSSSQTFCASTQTDLLSSEVVHKADLDSMLDKNASVIKHTMELELNEQIKEAKRNSHCYICLKPAAIHCCLSASYCTKTCQKKHSTAHGKSCTKHQEGRVHQESDPVQYCHQLNQTQTIARKTTSIHLQFEESSDVVTTANNEGNVYVYPPVSTSDFNPYAIPTEAHNYPLNLMIARPHLDRLAPHSPLFFGSPSVQSAIEMMCPRSRRRLT